MPAVGWSSRTQWSAYAAIVAVATLLAMVPATGPYFAWLFGELSPPVVVLAAGAVGAICLAALRRLDGFEILSRGSTMRGVAVGAGLATVLGIAIVIADLVFRYPEDMNAPIPQALAFYPSVGLIGRGCLPHPAPHAGTHCTLAVSRSPRNPSCDVDRHHLGRRGRTHLPGVLRRRGASTGRLHLDTCLRYRVSSALRVPPL